MQKFSEKPQNIFILGRLFSQKYFVAFLKTFAYVWNQLYPHIYKSFGKATEYFSNQMNMIETSYK